MSEPMSTEEQGQGTSSSSSTNCTFSFRKPLKRGGGQNARKREEPLKKDSDTSSSSSEDETKVVRIEKKVRRANPMVQNTGVRRYMKRDKGSSGSDDDDNDHKNADAGSSASGPSRIGVSYESTQSGERAGPADMGATAIVEIETEKDRDAQAVYQRSLEINKEQKGKADDGIYRGLANYTKFYEKKDTAMGNAASGMNRKGPIRAPENLRVTVRWDYQPDICKDYKETGFCGFGDSCKFLHDRSDYKFGWQIEKEVAEGRYGNDDDNPNKYEVSDSSDEDDLPFKCILCRGSFVSPVMTKCNHYFCEKCALDHYKKSQRCFACKAQTHGVFNPAKKLQARLKLEEQQAAGHGQHDDDDDDMDPDAPSTSSAHHHHHDESGSASLPQSASHTITQANDEEEEEGAEEGGDDNDDDSSVDDSD